ncbi:uncharacterized protein LOC143213280 isoform X2 [Lasioglossum baleicum]|uniref:uncharacterized protein LOC143213280 isoform X2 n=1 Tax=Lasioglossum baleicum TaxID=434251 RepID=UPI003FCC4FC8
MTDTYPRVNFRSYRRTVVIHFVGGSVDLLVRLEAELMYEGCASARSWRAERRSLRSVPFRIGNRNQGTISPTCPETRYISPGGPRNACTDPRGSPVDS